LSRLQVRVRVCNAVYLEFAVTVYDFLHDGALASGMTIAFPKSFWFNTGQPDTLQ
jgi:hypothetical protein